MLFDHYCIQVDHLADKTRSAEVFSQYADPAVGPPPQAVTDKFLKVGTQCTMRNHKKRPALEDVSWVSLLSWSHNYVPSLQTISVWEEPWLDTALCNRTILWSLSLTHKTNTPGHFHPSTLQLHKVILGFWQTYMQIIYMLLAVWVNVKSLINHFLLAVGDLISHINATCRNKNHTSMMHAILSTRVTWVRGATPLISMTQQHHHIMCRHICWSLGSVLVYNKYTQYMYKDTQKGSVIVDPTYVF